MARAAKILLILMVSAGAQTASAADNVKLAYFNWIPTGNGILEPDDTWKFTYIIERNFTYFVTCYYDLEIYLSSDDSLDRINYFHLGTYVQYMPYNTTMINTTTEVIVQDRPLPHPNGWYYVFMYIEPGSLPPDPDRTDNAFRSSYQIMVDSGTASTYMISGHIEDSTGQGIAGVALNGLPGTPVTDSQGFYTSTVDHGFTATVTPSANNLTFEPLSKNYDTVTQDYLTDDYAAQLIQCKISGRVLFPNGKPVAGVTVDFDDGTVSSETTDPNGYYGHYFASGWSGSIQPAKNTHTFTPTSRILADVLLNTEANFVADRAGILYVDPNAPGNNDGSDWPNAFNRLQDAIAEASANNDIYVAHGTYRPDEGGFGTPNNSYATFQLVAGAGLYGGFPNGGAEWSQRKPSNYTTILSGNISGGQAFHVVTGADGAILDGFVVSDGNAGLSGTDGRGGGMYIHDVNLTVRNCIFRDNYAREFGGAVYALADSPGDPISLTLDNCIFEENTSREDGGAIYSKYSVAEIVNCTIAKNTSSDSPNGAGVYGSNSSVTVLNSILWGNTADGSSSLQAQIYSAPLTAAVDYSCVQNLGAGGTGNIGSDPNFVNAGGPDYHLNLGSPCINRGSPNANYTDKYDIDGDRRLRYGRADMGADEFIGIDGDLQPDGVVNIADFGILAGFWNQTCSAPSWCSDCDINQSEHVDLADAVVVMEQWLSPLSDGIVNMYEFATMAGFWNKTCSAPGWCDNYDINKSGRVDLTDAVAVAEQWLNPLVE